MSFISTKELATLQPLKPFLSEYEIVYQKPIGHSHPTTILLGETHTSAQHRTLNGRLITHIASIFPRTFVLLEGLPSGERIIDQDEKRSISRTFCIEEGVLDKTEFLGWDGSKEVLDRVGYPVYNLQEMRVDRKSLRDQLKQLYQQIRIVQNQLVEQDEEIMSMSEEEFAVLDRQLTASLARAETLKEQLLEKIKAIDSIFAKNLATEATVRATFPARTDAMVKTLTDIEKMRRNGQIVGPAILLAGQLHLHTFSDLAAIPEYNLAPLYRQLDTQSSSIVLVPKTPDTPTQVEESK